MYKLIALIFFCLLSSNLFSQSGSIYQKDLDFLYQSLIKTPSYKDQILGERKKAYQKLYEQLRAEPVGPQSIDTFYKLSQLLIPIKDKHLSFYQLPNQTITVKMLRDTAFVNKYRASQTFQNFPKVTLDIDSLEAALSAKPKDSIEGIYYIGEFGKLGVFRTAKKDSLVGVMLSEAVGNWGKGQVVLVLKQSGTNIFNAFYADLMQKSLSFVKSEKLSRGKLRGNIRKSQIRDFSEFSRNKVYDLKTLHPDLQYLYLGTFKSSDEDLEISKSFYDRIADSLKAPHLIVDLRQNYGGGDKSSDKFYSLLKNYAKDRNIYVLINHDVYSNAEQFIVRLKKLKNVKVFGETTYGMVTYGKNYGSATPLPSGKFAIYTTDMKDSGHFLPYEETGVQPDVFLKPDSDWIEQLKKIINSK
jgi:hypothetical protein